MKSIPCHSAAQPTLPRLDTLLRPLMEWLARSRLRATTISDLELLDHRDLRDMGISRYDFRSIADGTCRRDGG